MEQGRFKSEGFIILPGVRGVQNRMGSNGPIGSDYIIEFFSDFIYITVQSDLFFRR